MIHFVGDYYIDSDSYQFILLRKARPVPNPKKSGKQGQLGFKRLGYFSDIDQVARAVVRITAREAMEGDNVIPIKEFIEKCNTVLKDLSDAVEFFRKSVILTELPKEDENNT